MTTKKKANNKNEELSTCTHCGVEIKAKNLERHMSKVHDAEPKEQVQEDTRSSVKKGPKREQRRSAKLEAREKAERTRQDLMWFSGMVVVILIIVAGYYIYTHPPEISTGNNDDNEIEQNISLKTVVANGTEEVRIPLLSLRHGKAFYYYFDTNNTRVNYFILQNSEGDIHVRFDTCEKCYDQKKGYRQSGDAMVCNSCDQRFEFKGTEGNPGVCYPLPLNHTIIDNNIIIKSSDISDGSYYFK
jgi:uncharacterized membrane protein